MGGGGSGCEGEERGRNTQPATQTIKYTLFQKPGASMEWRHCGQDKRIFFCPVHNASTPCSLQAFGIRCIRSEGLTSFFSC